MLRFNSLRNKNNEEFTRKAGIPYDCFMILLARIKNEISTTLLSNKLKRRGRKSSMIIEDKLLLTLYYLRHYPTFDNLGDLYNICSSYANDIYHEYLSMIIKTRHVPCKNLLKDPSIKSILIDVTEQPIERPKTRQKKNYSGKKKQHTIKVQLVVEPLSSTILDVKVDKGSVHDFTIFKNSRLDIANEIEVCVDLGYQGIDKYVKNISIPDKKPRKGVLTAEQKLDNTKKSKKRVFVEHVNRFCKIFRIAKEVYRGKQRNISKTWNVIAGLVNLRYSTMPELI
jgi:hypothetical protein